MDAMTVAGKRGSPPCPNADDVRAAYPVAVQLRLDANRAVFDRFNIMLLTNSIILVGQVQALGATPPLLVPVFLLSLFGALVSWVWLLRIRRGRHAISGYSDAVEHLERCMGGVTTFRTGRARARVRRESVLSRWLKNTPVDKIGAAELTIVPLTVIYGYLALLALDRLGLWSLANVAEGLFLILGVLLICAGILQLPFVLYRTEKNLRAREEEWDAPVVALLLSAVLGLVGIVILHIAPLAL
jgi:hypothetical protein